MQIALSKVGPSERTFDLGKCAGVKPWDASSGLQATSKSRRSNQVGTEDSDSNPQEAQNPPQQLHPGGRHLPSEQLGVYEWHIPNQCYHYLGRVFIRHIWETMWTIACWNETRLRRARREGSLLDIILVDVGASEREKLIPDSLGESIYVDRRCPRGSWDIVLSC